MTGSNVHKCSRSFLLTSPPSGPNHTTPKTTRCQVKPTLLLKNSHSLSIGTNTKLSNIKSLRQRRLTPASTHIDHQDLGLVQCRQDVNIPAGRGEIDEPRRWRLSEVQLTKDRGVLHAHLHKALHEDISDEGGLGDWGDGGPASGPLSVNRTFGKCADLAGGVVNSEHKSTQGGVGRENVVSAGDDLRSKQDSTTVRCGTDILARETLNLDGKRRHKSSDVCRWVSLDSGEENTLILGEEGMRDGIGRPAGRSGLVDLEGSQGIHLPNASVLVEAAAGDAGKTACGSNADQAVLSGGGDGGWELARYRDGLADEGEFGRVGFRDGEHGDGVGAGVYCEEELEEAC